MWRRNGFYQKLLLEARWLISLQTNDRTFVNTYTALCLPTVAKQVCGESICALFLQKQLQWVRKEGNSKMEKRKALDMLQKGDP